MSEKIQSHHQARKAYVYVRQSTMHQVRNNLESQRRQYDLEQRARSLGFAASSLSMTIWVALGQDSHIVLDSAACRPRSVQERWSQCWRSRHPAWREITGIGIISSIFVQWQRHW